MSAISALQQEIREVIAAELANHRAWLEDRLAKLAQGGAGAADDPARPLSIAEAAERAHRAPDTLRKAIKAKKLKASKPEGGREWVIELGDLLAYLKRPLRPAPRAVPDPVDARRGVDDVVTRALATRGGRGR